MGTLFDRSTVTPVIFALAVSMLLSFTLTPLVKRLAYKIGAVDVPKDKRRMHDHPIPRLGGLAIFAGCVIAILLFAETDRQLRGILLGSCLIVAVGVVDERSELAGSFMGIPQNDMGMRTDVLDGCPKEKGMLMLLRSMSPQVVAIDELGSEGELKALGQAAACGCRILATVHGENRRDVERRFGLERAFWERLFGLFIVLGKAGGKCVVRRMEEGEGGA